MYLGIQGASFSLCYSEGIFELLFLQQCLSSQEMYLVINQNGKCHKGWTTHTSE